MGGAVTSVEGDIESVLFNPAAVSLYKGGSGRHLTLFINPISAAAVGIKGSDLFQGRGSKIDDALMALSLVVKSAVFTSGDLQLGVLMGEEGIGSAGTLNRSEPFAVDGYRQNHSHALYGRLRLADQVSIGAAAHLIYQSKATDPSDRFDELGLSYGILLEPENGLRVGVSLTNLPDSLSENRQPLDRIIDEAVNVGLSYEIAGSRLSLDVRNLGEEKKQAVREIHLGFEQALFSHVALRAGWFRRKDNGQVYSWGIGVFDGNAVHQTSKKLTHRNFYVNYAFLYDKTEVERQRIHLLSFFLRL